LNGELSSDNGEDMVRSDANCVTFSISIIDCMDMFVFSVAVVLGLKFFFGALGLNDSMPFLGIGVQPLDSVIGHWGDEASLSALSRVGRNSNSDTVRLLPELIEQFVSRDLMFQGNLPTTSVGLGVQYFTVICLKLLRIVWDATRHQLPFNSPTRITTVVEFCLPREYLVRQLSQLLSSG
jgi:hypothetical protein